MKLCGNLENPLYFIVGCFHGDEPQGKFLIEKYLETHKKTKNLFLPCLNEFGVEHNMRLNKNFVDLNRNYPTKNWNNADKGNYYGGEAPASEEETKFVIDVIEKYKPKAILTLHAPYKVVNYDGDGEELAQKISEIIKYPVEGSIGYPTPGSFGTWAGVERNIPTITLELDEEVDVEMLVEPVSKIFEMLESY